MYLYRLVFLAAFFLVSSLKAEICDDWFGKLKIKNKLECESLCRVGMVDMATYMCRQQCDLLCKKSDDKKNVSENFYGLTDNEIEFCKQNKLACLKAYKLSWDAENICLSIYAYSDMNDESDACRHYVWSILLSREIGEKHAETVLNGHENNPKEPKEQQAMDLANNRLGLFNFQKNKENFKSDEDIKKSFIDQLKKNKFIVIKPNYSDTGGLP